VEQKTLALCISDGQQTIPYFIYMKVLVFGSSGSGKTYIVHALQGKAIPVFDADEIRGLSAWYDKYGRKAPEPKNAADALNNQYSFRWSRKFLTAFLNTYSDVFIFGGSGNVFDILDLFDKVYFLKIDTETQRQRLQNAPDRNPDMDFKQDELIVWGQWLEAEAMKNKIPFIDGTLTPLQVYSIICKNEKNQE